MNGTPCHMNALSSTTTPSQINVWLDILQRFPTTAFFWISTNAPIFVSLPISQPYRFIKFESCTFSPSFTSLEMQLLEFIGRPGILSSPAIHLLLPASSPPAARREHSRTTP